MADDDRRLPADSAHKNRHSPETNPGRMSESLPQNRGGKTSLDAIAAQMASRRKWLELPGSAAGLNGCDVFLLGLMALFAPAKRIVVDDAAIAARLAGCVDVSVSPYQSLEARSFDANDLSLFSVTSDATAAIAMAVSSSTMTLLYGWNSTWRSCSTFAHINLSAYSARPISGLAPAVWQSSLLVLSHDAARAQADTTLSRAIGLLADQSLDPFMLLDEVHKLRGAQSPRQSAAAHEAEQLRARLSELERDAADLRRLALMQQESLALLHAKKK